MDQLQPHGPNLTHRQGSGLMLMMVMGMMMVVGMVVGVMTMVMVVKMMLMTVI